MRHFEDLSRHSATRLSETVAWCLGATDGIRIPLESIEAHDRRRLGARAGEFAKQSVQASGPKFWKSYLLRRALRLYAKAKLYQLLPLSLTASIYLSCSRVERFESRHRQRFSAQLVEALAEKRAEQMRKERRYPSTVLQDLAGGRLLLYAPDENLCDGAAQSSSKGFFDVDNIPPWDTWICFSSNIL